MPIIWSSQLDRRSAFLLCLFCCARVPRIWEEIHPNRSKLQILTDGLLPFVPAYMPRLIQMSQRSLRILRSAKGKLLRFEAGFSKSSMVIIWIIILKYSITKPKQMTDIFRNYQVPKIRHEWMRWIDFDIWFILGNDLDFFIVYLFLVFKDVKNPHSSLFKILLVYSFCYTFSLDYRISGRFSIIKYFHFKSFPDRHFQLKYGFTKSWYSSSIIISWALEISDSMYI